MSSNKLFLSVPLCVLSGVLLTVGLPKLELYYCSWVALVPLFAAIRGKTVKQALWLGYLCGIAHFATMLYWIWYVIDYYGGLPFAVAVLILLLLSAYLAVYVAVFSALARKWESNFFFWLFGLPSAWVTLELIRAYAVSGFPWGNLGYTQAPLASLIQVADITGVYGVSWLVVLGNTAIAAFLYRFHMKTGVIALAVCVAGATAYGAWRVEVVKGLQSLAVPFTVGVVQGNIDQSKKWDPAFQQETLRRYQRLSMEASVRVPAPELLVWPETAAPFFYGIDDKLTPQLNELIQQAGIPLLFGSPGALRADGEIRLLNKAYLVDGRAELKGAYAKQHLVPFGEYVPYARVLFFVHRLVHAAGDFMAGKDPDPLRLDERPLGVLICYEGIFPELSRATVRAGATALVNITNDAWYGNTSAPYQHLEMARWRAIECRVPMIRAANTGISAIYDATGTPCGLIPLGQEGYLVCSVRPFRLVTFYTRFGDIFAWLCVLITLSGIIYSTFQRRVAFK